MGALKKPIRLTLRKKLVFAATATILFFLLLEALLAGIGFRPQANQTDRTVGFSSYAPLFVETTDGQGRAVLATAQNKLHWFNYQTFPKEKAAGTQRIFCMGGSTTYGHPYWDETSFAVGCGGLCPSSMTRKNGKSSTPVESAMRVTEWPH